MSFVLGAVLGATIAGTFQLLNSYVERLSRGRETELERQRRKHSELVEASIAYLDAAEHFVRALLNTPPLRFASARRYIETGNTRYVVGAVARLLSSLMNVDPIDHSSEDDARVSIEREFYRANARLQLVGPPEVIAVLRKVERFVVRWQDDPRFEVAMEWPDSLRPRVIKTLQRASCPNLPPRKARSSGATA